MNSLSLILELTLDIILLPIAVIWITIYTIWIKGFIGTIKYIDNYFFKLTITLDEMSSTEVHNRINSIKENLHN